MIYRKQGRIDDEVQTLERYDRQIKSPGRKPAKVKERLAKARKLRRQHRGA